MRFDHLLHWVPDLGTAAAACAALGFRPVYGGEHPNRGTHNTLCHFGLPYVELLAVHDWAMARASNLAPQIPRISAALDSGGGALAFAVAVDDLAATVGRVRAAGIPIDDPTPGSRQRPDGSVVSWSFARVQAGPAWRPFFIQWGLPPAARAADLRACGVVSGPADTWALDHLVAETLNPAEGSQWLGALLGLAPGPDGSVPLPGARVLFSAGPAERITRIGFGGTAGPQAGMVAGLAVARA